LRNSSGGAESFVWINKVNLHGPRSKHQQKKINETLENAAIKEISLDELFD
jgi:hypothetical protein